MLHRAFYQRDGSTRAVTFHADNLIDVCDFVALWERLAKVIIHRIVAVPRSPQ